MPFLRTFAETCKQNRMKPALTYYALLVLLLAFCFSCKTDSEKKKYVIGVSQCTLEGSWRKSMLLDMKDVYKRQLNYYVYQETPFRIEDISKLGDL